MKVANGDIQAMAEGQHRTQRRQESGFDIIEDGWHWRSARKVVLGMLSCWLHRRGQLAAPGLGWVFYRGYSSPHFPHDGQVGFKHVFMMVY
jgi:hypothetical protein